MTSTVEGQATEAQCVRILYRHAHIAVFVTTLAAIVVAPLVWPQLPNLWVGGWLGGFLLITVLRLLLLRQYRRRNPADEELDTWRGYLAVVNFLSGSAWGVLVILLVWKASLLHQIFVLAVAVGLSAGAISVTGAVPSVYLALTIPALIPPALALVSQPGSEQKIIGLLLAVAALVYYQMVRHYRKTLGQSLALGAQNRELIDDLRSAKETAERSNSRLLAEIAERTRAQARLEESERKFRGLAESSDCLIFVFRNKFLYANPAAEELSGYSQEEIRRLSFWEVVHPDHREQVMQRGDARLRGDAPPNNYDVKLLTKDGQVRWARISLNRILYEKRPAVIGTAVDITQRKLTEAALFREKERAQVTLQSIGDGVITTDVNGTVDYMNPIAEMLTGMPVTGAVGRKVSQLLRLERDDGGPIADPVAACLERHQDVRNNSEILLLQRDGGSEHAVELTAAPIRDRGGSVIGAVLVLHDVTELHGLSRRMSYAATHDALTDLINRREFESRLEDAIRSAHQAGKQHALLYMDLDRFKAVNDSCGHQAGDALLIRLAGQLRQQVRETDTLARLGGDEFGLLLTSCPLDKAGEIAEELRRKVAGFRFDWQGQVFEIGVSIGLVPVTAASGRLSELLSCADAACYAAKDQGRNRVHVFQAEDPAMTRHHGEMRWMQRIEEALEHDGFMLYLQPIRTLGTQTTDTPPNGEILIRMRGENGAAIPPGRFIPAAERYILMPLIDRWVVDNTVDWLLERSTDQPVPPGVTINLSGQSLMDEGCVGHILQRLGAHEGIARRICFEISESSVAANVEHAHKLVARLAEMGCRVALDNFGSGLNAFSCLKQLPADYLKIGGEYVRDMASHPLDRTMVESVVQIARVMHIRTIASSVEQQTVAEQLRQLGVDYAQGFAFGAPQPLAEAMAPPAPAEQASGIRLH